MNSPEDWLCIASQRFLCQCIECKQTPSIISDIGEIKSMRTIPNEFVIGIRGEAANRLGINEIVLQPRMWTETKQFTFFAKYSQDGEEWLIIVPFSPETEEIKVTRYKNNSNQGDISYRSEDFLYCPDIHPFKGYAESMIARAHEWNEPMIKMIYDTLE
jgi:hypothetical protein